MEIWRMRNKFPSCFQLVQISFKKEISSKMEALMTNLTLTGKMAAIKNLGHNFRRVAGTSL
jgi:hypothetical protein